MIHHTIDLHKFASIISIVVGNFVDSRKIDNNMYLISWAKYALIFILSVNVAIAGTSPEALRLTQLSQEYDDFIIRVTDGKLDAFTGVRDYYTLVVLTSSSSAHGCVACHEITRALRMVAKSYFKDYLPLNSLFFVEIDLIHQPNFEIASAIQLNTIPHVWLVPPNAKEQYDPYAIIKEQHFVFKIPKGSIKTQAFELAQFISTTVQKSIYLRKEGPFSNFMVTFSVTFLVIMLFKKKGPRIIVNLGKTFVYKALTLVAVLTSTTGYQYTQIQKVPFIARNEKGIILISGGSGYQFGIETFIVSGNYALLGAAFILLIYLGNYKSSSNSVLSEKVKDYLILVNAVVLYILYSCLTSIALRKDHDYPYHFTKLF